MAMKRIECFEFNEVAFPFGIDWIPLKAEGFESSDTV